MQAPTRRGSCRKSFAGRLLKARRSLNRAAQTRSRPSTARFTGLPPV
jgi:hypothetical protein